MLVFQKIIEMVEGIMKNRLERKRPQTKTKPRPLARGIPSSKQGSNQAGSGHAVLGTQPGRDNTLSMTTGATQPQKTTNISGKTSDQSAVALNEDVKTSCHDLSLINNNNKEGSNDRQPVAIHDSDLRSPVSGSVDTSHIERCQSLSDLEENEENTGNVIDLGSELTDESSTDYLTLPKDKTSSDVNGNVVDVSNSQEVDIIPEQVSDEDCIDGPLDGAVHFAGHRPRSHHISNMDGRKVRRKLSRALRFQVQPKVVKGDVSRSSYECHNNHLSYVLHQEFSKIQCKKTSTINSCT